MYEWRRSEKTGTESHRAGSDCTAPTARDAMEATARLVSIYRVAWLHKHADRLTLKKLEGNMAIQAVETLCNCMIYGVLLNALLDLSKPFKQSFSTKGKFSWPWTYDLPSRIIICSYINMAQITFYCFVCRALKSYFVLLCKFQKKNYGICDMIKQNQS